MNQEQERQVDIETENIALQARDIINRQENQRLDRHDLNLIFLTAAKIKPVSTFGIKKEDLNALSAITDRLELKSVIYPANKWGYCQVDVSRDQELLGKFSENEDQAGRQDKIGEMLGYPDSAIEEFLAQTGDSPAKFWVDVSGGRQVPDELIACWVFADMIPASFDDKQSIEFGKRIIGFLNMVDPVFTSQTISEKHRDIVEESQEAILKWKI